MSWSQGKKLRETQAREADGEMEGRVRDGRVMGAGKGTNGGDAYSETERHERKLRKMGW